MPSPAPSELIISSRNTIYHLDLSPDEIADTVLLVGDPERVALVSSFFSRIEHKKAHREFITHTGYFNGQRISVVGTGIGTDNIDIVLTELDALVNIDFNTRQIKEKKTALRLIRLGSSGSLHPHIDVDSFVCTEYAVGLDNLMYYYAAHPQVMETALTEALQKALPLPPPLRPYAVCATAALAEQIGQGCFKGITFTAPGFYGPQGRTIRLNSILPKLDALSDFSYKGCPVSNFEMETSALYGLGRLLDHQVCTICVIIANRLQKKFSANLTQRMTTLIEQTLIRLTAS